MYIRSVTWFILLITMSPFLIMWITSLKQCQHNLPKSVERVFLSARILFVYGASQMGILLQYSCLCLAPCAVCSAMNVLQRYKEQVVSLFGVACQALLTKFAHLIPSWGGGFSWVGQFPSKEVLKVIGPELQICISLKNQCTSSVCGAGQNLHSFFLSYWTKKVNGLLESCYLREKLWHENVRGWGVSIRKGIQL